MTLERRKELKKAEALFQIVIAAGSALSFIAIGIASLI